MRSTAYWYECGVEDCRELAEMGGDVTAETWNPFAGEWAGDALEVIFGVSADGPSDSEIDTYERAYDEGWAHGVRLVTAGGGA